MPFDKNNNWVSSNNTILKNGNSYTQSIGGALSSPASEVIESATNSGSIVDIGDVVGDIATDSPWYKNGDLLSGYAGLASSLVQLAALPSQMKLAKTQTKALQQNIATAKEEQARRNKNIAGFNQPVSQLMQPAAQTEDKKPMYSSFASRTGI